ncbi:hypothetical protein OOK13_25020 [Streptomyces sp. NBC_00378]|uniref:phage tail protein n=1 Tax=Streptomyces sp. NBC_00378 TaxID=2975732 RepID=UPI00225BAA42|nr:hypothetical protein [Streptomyces sp. NBC_00378]MCX5111748.1 hypothetical protein [Streptomyces sp. NBC_00378]
MTLKPEVSRSQTPPPHRPPADRPAPDPRSVQRLQRAAGNRAVSRLVAQRYTAPVKPSPAQAPGFRKVKADVAAKKVRLAAHVPAATESKSAQDAAVAPPDDKEAQGKAANAEKMNAAKPGEFNKQAFIDAVNKAIDAQAPKNLDQADKFSKSGKADQIKDEVDGKVKDGKDSSAKDIDTATKAPPDTSAAKDKPVTPMTPDQAPANPGAPSAADAVPDKQPASVTDFSQGPAANDQAMADAEVTEDQLAKGNEPDFDQALSTKKTAEADSAKAPAKGKAAEAQQLSTAKAGAAASGTQALNALTATRASAGKQVDGGKGETKSKDEKKRAEVTAKLQKVYDGTKKDVEETLSGLDKKVDDKFTSGEKAARDAFTADHKRRMKKYKDKRYSGMFGGAKWAKDKLMGMPKEANDLFQEARKLYVAQMQTVISSVADIIGTELGRAKARIAKGRTELKAEVDKLPADLREFGQEAATDFAGKFDDLEATVNEKSEQLVQDLAQKYTAALNKVDEEIKKLQEANKGLIDKAKDAIVGVIKTINELKNLLLGILAKAASAIMKIIKDPIGFLGNLVKAVGAGLNLFITNIAEHLKTGVVSWLLGTAVKAGLELPQKFDLRGIIQLIGSLLGLTWANIRARITRKGIPDQAMTAVESSVPVAKKLATEGPAGAVKEITEEAGDLKATILEKLTSYLIPTVIIAGITWIISLLNPASAFVRAVKGIIDIVTFIVNQGAQIVEFVNAVLDAVIAIANGGSAGVPKMVEAALAASVPLLIGFLASLLGIGSLANKVKSVFHAVARPVNRAIDKIVNFIAKKGKALWNKLKGKNGKDGKGNDKKPGQDKNDGKKGNERQAIDESSKLLAKNPAKKDAVDGISAIARRNKVPSLHLVTDSRTDQTEKVHVQTMATPSYQLGPGGDDLTPPLREIFESLASQDAKQQFDKFRKGANSMETFEKTMLAKKRAAENLSQSMDEFLANIWRKGSEGREKEPPDASIIAKIEATLAEVARVERRIRGYSSANPSVRGTERWLRVMTNQRTALERAKLDKGKAKSVANIEEGYASYIRSVDAEVEAAENSRNVVEVGMPIRSEPIGKSDADVVADDGRTWKDSKDYLPFGLGSGNWEKLSIQVDRQLEIANDPAYTIDGRPPKLVYYFPRGVMQEVAEALERKGVGVEGERITDHEGGASSGVPRDGGSG